MRAEEFHSEKHQFRFPAYGVAGAGMMIIFWYLNWHLEGLRSHWAFFPLWLGYILTVNGITHRIRGSSLLSRNLKAWIFLFILSAPLWWVFEWLNQVAGYWKYIGIETFSDLEYSLYCTLNFSVVVPAIFCTSELVSAFSFAGYFRNGLKAGVHARTRITFFVAGWIMLIIFLIWPRYSAPLLWMSVFFILDPLNYWLGYKTILRETAEGNWQTVIMLWISSLICGFFWELWNFHSYPRWIYDVPFVDFWYVFEMPLLGYLGYLPFSLELYAMYHFILGISNFRSPLRFRSS